jgi:hypothetical protein
MADDLKITITATDGASKVFTAVERSAREMGDGIEEAAEKAGGEFRDMVRAAQDMATALDRNTDRTGQSMGELQRSIDRLATSMEGQLAAGARDAGTALNQVETEAEQAATAMDQAGDASQRAGVNLQDIASAGRTAGAGLAILGASFTMYAGQARDAEIATMALERTYGAAAQQFIALANSMQATTVFSNDQVIAAANIMGTLKRNYELTDQQIQQLIMTSADLAAVNGTTLVDAAQRVAAAIRGEAESAEMLGLTMNQAAIDQDNLTLSMSNAEAGAFRFNALMDQSAFATGAAAEQAQTTAGEFQQLGNRVQDAATDFVAFTGPVGEAVSGLSTWGLEAGLALTGAVTLTKGVRDLTVAMRGLQTTAAAGGTISALSGLLGSGGLAGAIGAAGTAALLAAPAVVTLGGAVYYLAQANQELHSTIDAQTDALSAWVAAMPSEIDHQNLTYFAQDVRDIGTAVAAWDPSTGANSVVEFKEAFDELLSLNPASLLILQDILAGYGMSLQDLSHLVNDPNALGIIYQAIIDVAIEQERAQAATDAYTGAMLENQDQLAQSAAMSNVFAESTAESTEALNDNTEAIIANTNAKLSNGNVVRDSEEDIHQWAEAVSYGNTAIEDQTTALLELRAAIGAIRPGLAGWVAEQTAVNDSLAGFAQAWSELDGILRGSDALDRMQQLNFESDLTDTRGALRPYADALYEAAEATTELVSRTQEAPDALGSVEAAARAQVDIWGQYEDALAGVADQFGMLSTNARLFQAAGIESPSLDVAVNLQGGQDALDSVFGTIVGQTNAMSQQLGSVESWADKLIGDPGVWSQLDQLLEDGRISLEQYNAAQEAQVRISTDVENAQQDLLAVQAGLAPVIADATRRQAEYIDSLQDLDTQGQLAALGFMDQAQSMKALEIAQLAAASSTDTQKAATTAMITEMANADPVLAAMLEKMGLISVGADGTITVNFDEATSATDAIEKLNTSIEALTDLIADIFNVDTDTDAATTQVAVEALTGAVNGIPKDVTTYVHLVDNASLKAAEIRDILTLLDGTTATTYVNTVQTGSLSLNNPFARDGGPIGYANGGLIAASLAEAGGELLSFRDGTSAIVPHPGVYLVEPGTQVLPAPATAALMRDAAQASGGGGGNVAYYGPVTQQITYDASSFAMRRRGLADARRY